MEKGGYGNGRVRQASYDFIRSKVQVEVNDDFLYMELIMKKVITLIITIGFYAAAHAQQLGVGGMINHTSTGILFTYSPDWKKNWHLDLGIRYFAKVNLIGDNEQSFAFYQQGYTEDFWEKFAVNARISHKLFSYKFIRMDF